MNIKSIPSDTQIYGAITRRTSGILTTLTNPKPGKEKKLGSSIKGILNFCAPSEGILFVSFDFSSLEAVIAAVLNDAEHCRWNNIPAQSLITEISKITLLGSSEKGTDIHSVISKQIGIGRNPTKTMIYSSLYGSGQEGVKNLLRPLIPNTSEEKLTKVVSDFFLIFKGKKVYGTPYWEDGYYSHFFNYCHNLVSESKPRLPYHGSLITQTLQPHFVGNDFKTSRMNWVCQAGGAEVLDKTIYTVDTNLWNQSLQENVMFWGSCHDEIIYLCKKDCVNQFADLLKQSHSEVWASFFTSFGMVMPPEVGANIMVNCDYIPRKEVNVPYTGLDCWPKDLVLVDGYNL